MRLPLRYLFEQSLRLATRVLTADGLQHLLGELRQGRPEKPA